MDTSRCRSAAYSEVCVDFSIASILEATYRAPKMEPQKNALDGQGYGISFTAREMATLDAALGEYLYILEEGDLETFVASTDAFRGHTPLDAMEIRSLRMRLRQVGIRDQSSL